MQQKNFFFLSVNLIKPFGLSRLAEPRIIYRIFNFSQQFENCFSVLKLAFCTVKCWLLVLARSSIVHRVFHYMQLFLRFIQLFVKTMLFVSDYANGKLRYRFCVSANSALATAGANGGTPGSPTPAGAR